MQSAGNGEGRQERRFGQITVRGVDRSLYRRLSRLARRMGVNVGTLLNQSMELFLSMFPHDGEPPLPGRALGISAEFMRGFLEGLGHVVEDIDELTLTRRDLLEADRELVLLRIKRL
ncbi:MAG: hypothetical protein DRO01_05325, partial [Thermoproteota archaeon]